MRQAIQTEVARFTCSPILLSKVKDTARSEGATLSEFIRQALRDKLSDTGSIQDSR